MGPFWQFACAKNIHKHSVYELLLLKTSEKFFRTFVIILKDNLEIKFCPHG